MAFKVGQKLVCINTSEITRDYSLYIHSYHCEELTKNEIYTAGETFIDEDGDEVVFIKEMNHSYLAFRFRPLDYGFVEEVLSKIKEQALETHIPTGKINSEFIQ